MSEWRKDRKREIVYLPLLRFRRCNNGQESERKSKKGGRERREERGKWTEGFFPFGSILFAGSLLWHSFSLFLPFLPDRCSFCFALGKSHWLNSRYWSLAGKVGSRRKYCVKWKVFPSLNWNTNFTFFFGFFNISFFSSFRLCSILKFFQASMFTWKFRNFGFLFFLKVLSSEVSHVINEQGKRLERKRKWYCSSLYFYVFFSAKLIEFSFPFKHFLFVPFFSKPFLLHVILFSICYSRLNRFEQQLLRADQQRSRHSTTGGDVVCDRSHKWWSEFTEKY